MWILLDSLLPSPHVYVLLPRWSIENKLNRSKSLTTEEYKQIRSKKNQSHYKVCIEDERRCLAPHCHRCPQCLCQVRPERSFPFRRLTSGHWLLSAIRTSSRVLHPWLLHPAQGGRQEAASHGERLRNESQWKATQDSGNSLSHFRSTS